MINKDPILTDDEIAELAETLKEDIEPGIPTRNANDMPEVIKDAFSRNQADLLAKKTPPQFIKSRPGAGGKSFSYVTVGYVISILNNAFGHLWDWEILEQQIGATQIWVKGKLTVNSFSTDQKIIKMSYGGSDIKVNHDGKIIDIANDLKSASADALKKAASMVGIAQDIYFPEGEE